MSNTHENILLPFEIPIYEGKDPNTTDFRVCHGCLTGEEDSSPSKKMLACSGCRCAFYCSSTCQKSDWPAHKSTCKEIRKMEQKLQKEALLLEPTDGHRWGPGPQQSLFERYAGRFWGIMETRTYMRALFSLADKIHYDVAYEGETVEVWEKCLGHYSECMRLSWRDNLGARFRVPYILLALNRDDEAYAFCHYWINYEKIESYELREERHATSEAGDWVFPRGEANCRYQDIFEQSPDEEPTHMGLWALVPIAIVKLRLVAAHDDKIRRGVAGITQGETEVAESNRTQIQRLLDTIHGNNPSMLPAIINPMPLKSQPYPAFSSPGHPTEAYMVLQDANRHWVRVPGAAELLERRFGPNPSYNHNMSIL